MSAVYRYIVLLIVIALVAAGGLVVFAYVMELDRTYASLADTQKRLATTQMTLDTTTSTLAETSATLAEGQALNAALEGESKSLRNENERLAGNLAAVRDRAGNLLLVAGYTKSQLASTSAELSNTQSHLRETSNTLAQTQETLAQTQHALTQTQATLTDTQSNLDETASALEEQETLNARLADENADLRDEKSALQKNLGSVTEQYDDLVSHAGAKEQLEAEVANLRSEILRLQDERRPLILEPGDFRRSGFLCTGSMEPVLTCLDEARWRTVFDPSDIVVGATISFSPSCWGGSRGAAHRVMKIEIRDGTHYYWPKGDSNRKADGCWVPETNVRGYITRIHRGVRPENAELRNHVNDAKETYYGLLDQHCGPDAYLSDCPSDAPYSQIEEAHSLYYCWVDVARESEYPGHIPRSCS